MQYYRSLIKTAPELLLDTYSGASAAYSLRKLRTAYTGAAIRVRRDNDNAEQDIGFDSSGNLNESALTSFVGANSAFVTTWYDQSGNNQGASQTTQINQPRIVNAGVIDRQNGKPTIIYDGSIDRFQLNSGILNALHQSGFSSWFSVQTVSSASQMAVAGTYRFGTAETGFILYHNADRSLVHRINNTGNAVVINTTTSSLTTNSTNFLLSIIADPGNSTLANRSYLYYNTTLYQNNGSSFTPSTGGASRTPFIGVQGNPASLFWNGSISEIVIYFNDQSANRTGIQNNINTFYSIY